jgi:hypothetical protein
MSAVKSYTRLVACGVLAILAAMATSCSSEQNVKDLEFIVYKTPWCGCCTKWIDHLHENGFVVRAEELQDLAQLKLREGVGREISSCHTAIVDGYVIEGHVPADLIKRLLQERPLVAGLTVPGMPMGSPGMEGAYKEPYEVLTFDRDGTTEVYARR